MKKDNEHEELVDGVQEEELQTRRSLLLSLKKWSKVVIGAILVGGAVAKSGEEVEARGAWANRRGGGGGAWKNRGGGSGGAWRNRASGGGGWANRHGGGWANRSGGGWINGGGGWANWINGGGVWANGGGSWANRSGGGGWINRR